MNLTKQFFQYVSQNIFGLIGTSCYILADTYFIAQAAGTDGVTLLNLCLPMYNLIFAFGSMIGLGAATRYAILQAQGEARAQRYFSNAILCACLIAIPFMLAGAFCPGTLLQLMGGDADIVALGLNYTRIFLLFTPFFMCKLHLLGLRPQRRRPVPCHGGHPEWQPVQCGIRLHLHLPHGAGPARRGAGNRHLAGAQHRHLQPPLFSKEQHAHLCPAGSLGPAAGAELPAGHLPALSGSSPLL